MKTIQTFIWIFYSHIKSHQINAPRNAVVLLPRETTTHNVSKETTAMGLYSIFISIKQIPHKYK